MNINIEVVLNVNGINVLQKGTFPINNRRFKEDPDNEAAFIAQEWIKLLRKKSGYFYDSDIVRVKYNGENDITKLFVEG
ncbi:hypothetical protein [Peribacillus kribbensis]|uniref:hypothetical protein n=1 Tax=Peribacillus kribbensis TaxID=356658 RepID=UPI000427CBBB|nr:hypothetical protein [Peribacillus kribbensis]